jgi:hypothetical protein
VTPEPPERGQVVVGGEALELRGGDTRERALSRARITG